MPPMRTTALGPANGGLALRRSVGSDASHDSFSASPAFLGAEYFGDFKSALQRGEANHCPRVENKVMRASLLGSLAELYRRLHLPVQTFLHAAAICDHHCEETARGRSRPLQGPVMAAGALLIAQKMDKASCGFTLRQLADELQDMAACSFASYNPKDIRRAELTFLNSIGFAPLRPTIVEFLQQLQRNGVIEGLRYNLAERFAALCIHDGDLAKCAPSTIAAAVAVVAYAVPQRDIRCDGEDSSGSGSSPILDAQRQSASLQRARTALSSALRCGDITGLLSAAPRALRALVPEAEVAPAAAVLVQAVFTSAADDVDVSRPSIIGVALADAQLRGLDASQLAKHGGFSSPDSQFQKWSGDEDDRARALDALGVTLRSQPFTEGKAWWRTPIEKPSMPTTPEEQYVTPRSDQQSAVAHSYVPGCIARFQPVPRPLKKSVLESEGMEEKVSAQPFGVDELYKGGLDPFNRSVPTPQWHGVCRAKTNDQMRKTTEARRAACRASNGDVDASLKKKDAFSEAVADLDLKLRGQEMDRLLQSSENRIFLSDVRSGLSPSHGFILGSPMQAWGPSSTSQDLSLSHKALEQSQGPSEPILSPRSNDVKPVGLRGVGALGGANSPGLSRQHPTVPKLSTTPPPDYCLLFKRPLAVTTTSRRPGACAAHRTVSQAAVRFSAAPTGLRAAPLTTASTRIAPGYKGMRRSPWLARECKTRRSMA